MSVARIALQSDAEHWSFTDEGESHVRAGFRSAGDAWKPLWIHSQINKLRISR